VAAAGHAASNPQGAHHHVSNSGGGPYWTCRQHPLRGPAINVSLNLVPATRIFLATPTRGATAVNITATSEQLARKMEARVSAKKNLGPCGAKNPGIIIPLMKLSPNQQTAI
jgi:hypothetical protein